MVPPEIAEEQLRGDRIKSGKGAIFEFCVKKGLLYKFYKLVIRAIEFNLEETQL